MLYKQNHMTSLKNAGWLQKFRLLHLMNGNYITGTDSLAWKILGLWERSQAPLGVRLLLLSLRLQLPYSETMTYLLFHQQGTVL